MRSQYLPALFVISLPLALACSSFGADSPAPATPDGGGEAASPLDAGEPDAPSGDGTSGRVSLFTTHSAPHSIWADAGRVYFTETSKGHVHSVRYDGSEAQEHASQGAPQAIVAAANAVFWVDSAPGGGLMRVGTNPFGGALQVVIPKSNATNLTTDGVLLYFTTATEIAWQTMGGDAPQSRGSFANIVDVAVREKDIFWLDRSENRILAQDRDTGPVTTLHANLADCRSITTRASSRVVAACGDTIRFFEANDGDLANENKAYSLTSDGDDVYWLTVASGKGALRHLPPNSTTPTTIDSDFPVRGEDERELVHAIALTKEWVFWLSKDAVLRRPRP